MSHHSEFRVPATTANLGPGYGVVGLALDLWFDIALACEGSELIVERPDAPADKTLDVRHDPIVRGLRAAAQRFDIKIPEGLSIVVRGDAPRRCGLGSNTAEFVGGVQAACRFAKQMPPLDQRLDLAVALGGDPAHGAAALHGGLALAIPVRSSSPAATFRCLGAALSPIWWIAIAAPDIELATADVHRVVPASVPNAIVQRSSGRLAGLLHALAHGDRTLLGECLVDELHVPFRMGLVAGMARAVDAGIAAGAAGVTISGHGPALLAFASDAPDARQIADSMAEAFRDDGTPARSLVLRPSQPS